MNGNTMDGAFVDKGLKDFVVIGSSYLVLPAWVILENNAKAATYDAGGGGGMSLDDKALDLRKEVLRLFAGIHEGREG